MLSDRQSSVFAGVVVGCVAGFIAFLATGHEYATELNAAPVSTSSQVTVAPNSVVHQYKEAAALPEMATVEQAEYAPEVYEITPSAQVHSWGAIAAGVLAIPLALLGFALSGKKTASEERRVLVSIDDLMTVGKHAVVASAVVGASAAMGDAANAYPIFAQQTYSNPREATGRIVCANCHLATKETEIEVPQAVLPDQVFEAVSKVPFAGTSSVSSAVDVNTVVGSIAFQGNQPVEFVQESGIPVSQALVDIPAPATPNTVFKATIKIPYDQSLKQVGAKGKPADLNVGAVLVLPEGFTLAPPERIPEKLKEEINGLQFIKYSEDTPNILVVGPVPGKLYSEMHVALLSPDPATNKKAEYGSLEIHVGGNRGRGQLYPSGEKSNNNAYSVEHTGKIVDIELNEKKKVYTIAIEEANKETVREELPAGAELIVKKGDAVEAGQVITTNPNVGGFGQADTEIVLQEPGRVRALLFFSLVTLATQTLLVVKKKQYEQVQLSEMNF